MQEIDSSHRMFTNIPVWVKNFFAKVVVNS